MSNNQEEVKEQKFIGKRVKTAFTVSLVVLNLFFLYKFIDYRNTAGELEVRMVGLEGKLEETIDKLAKSKQQTQELNNLLRSTYEEIERLKTDLTTIDMDPETKSRLQEFLTITDQYKDQIDSLVRENQRLLTENQSLKELIEEEKGISSKLRSEKQALEKKLNTDAPLVLDNVVAMGIQLGANNREEPAMNLADLEKIKVCFDVKGQGSGSGDRSAIYISITDPQGRILADPKIQQGTFSKATGGKQSYTLKANILRNARSKNLCLYSYKSAKLTAGKYSVALYNGGQLVGSTSFMLL
jgi:cell fate (sporulation/competence/biofilm development) regulator YlbF (YheA/YmcA/DUF963 family)